MDDPTSPTISEVSDPRIPLPRQSDPKISAHEFSLEVSSSSVVLVLLENDSLEDRDDSELNDKPPFDGMLMRRYNFLSFEMRWRLRCSYSRRNLEYSRIRVFARAMRRGGLAMGAVIREINFVIVLYQIAYIQNPPVNRP